jgi:hypothetical protein
MQRQSPRRQLSHEIREDGLSPASATSEKLMTKERLSEIIERSIYSVCSRKVSGSGMGQERTSYSFAGPTDRQSPKIVDELVNYENRPSKEFTVFEGKNISEVMTIVKPADFDPTRGKKRDVPQTKYEALARLSAAQLSGEPAWVVNYAIASGDKYKYLEDPTSPDTSRKAGLDCVAVMRESDARELMSAVQQDPTLGRQLADVMIMNPDALNDATRAGYAPTLHWDAYRPPYEQWREQNGGFERLALRTASSQGPDEAQILEF